MDVTVGIMAHNEERNIGSLLEALLKQKTESVHINEIIVVSSGSTDRTDEVVKGFCKRNRRVRLVTEPVRMGKSRAINRFLSVAVTDVLVMESADTLPEPDTIESLCLPLNEDGVGATIARPVSVYSRGSLLGYSTNLVWDLYHLISMKSPKCGELMGFKRMFWEIGNTSVDEEFIGMLVAKNGSRCVYVPGAVYFNAGPRTIKGFLGQRRRAFGGHMFLRARSGYSASTMDFLEILRNLRRVDDKRVFCVLMAAVIEGIGRVLGLFDYLMKREDTIWKPAK